MSRLNQSQQAALAANDVLDLIGADTFFHAVEDAVAALTAAADEVDWLQ